ncbi:MAG: PAS domain-containing protein, partial [Bacteroidota bacterium]|nr:PAS domain-containing protein [Bacteroidota bacterium]
MQTNLLNQIQELQEKLAKAEKENQYLVQQFNLHKYKSGSGVKPKNDFISEPSYSYDTIFQQIYRESPEAMVILSLEGAILAVNKAFCSLVQYSESELLQIHYNDVVDQAGPVLNMIQQEKLRTGKYRGELILIRKDGSRFLAEVSANEYLDQDGQFKCWSIVRDISNEREALRQSERDYRDLFNKANDAILIFDPETEQIFDANQKACELYGYSLPDFTSMSLDEISKDIVRGRSFLHQLTRTGSLENVETTQYRKDKTEIHLSVSASFITYK